MDEGSEDDEGANEIETWSYISQNQGGKGRGRGKRTLDEEGIKESRGVRRKMTEEEGYKVVIKFKEGNELNNVSLSALTCGLKKSVGEVEMAKILRDGRLLIKCKDIGQRDKAMRVQSICNKSVSEARLFGEGRRARGVISGIPLGEKLEDLKKNIKGGTVVEVKRLKMNKNGEKVDSTSVLLEFQEEKLPPRVMIGFMSFSVREFIPPPVRCYKCQRYGHIAKVCKGKQRCGKCAGNHEYGQCGDNVVRKCCNCGGDHTAAYGGCPIRKKAVEVQQVRVEHNLTYAEAVQVSNREKKESHVSHVQERDKDVVELNAEKLVLFIAYVINCSEQAKTKTEKIKIIMKAANKFLNMKEVSFEKIQAGLGQNEMSEIVHPGLDPPC